MAINFPNSPSNGDTHVVGSKTFVYNSTTTSWSVQGGASVDITSITGDILPDADSSRSLGSASKKWKDLHLSGSTINLGNIKLKDNNGSLKVETAAGEEVSLGGVKQYDSSGAFPTSGNKLGTMVMSKDKKGLYLWDSSEWDRISLGPQIGPRFVTTPASNLDLINDGSTPLTFTLKAVDEGGFPVTYDWDAYSSSTVYDSDTLPPQITSVSRDSGVFSLLASTNSAHGGNVSFRAKASDGVLFTPYIVTLGLAFDVISALTGDATAGTVGSHKFWYSNHAAATLTSKYMNLTVSPGGVFYIGMVGATGAGHGQSNRGAGGISAFSNATITVPSGVTSLSVYTGGGGEQDDPGAIGFAAGGSLGGGNSGISGIASYAAGSAGGGLVGLFKNAYSATPSQADALMVVGSSGGASGHSAGTTLGGYGGKPGADGGSTDHTGGQGGSGGTASAGGAFATAADTGYTGPGTAGSALQGGTGGESTYDGGGGGGAGYFGGGGGEGGGGYSAGAGGGGSGYLASGQVINNATYSKSGNEYTGAPVTQLIAWADAVLGGSSGISSTSHGQAVAAGVNGNAGYAIVIELAS